MSPALLRVVFDCNVYFQALINEEGPAGKCVAAAFDGRVTLFITRFVMDEIRRTATDSALRAQSSAKSPINGSTNSSPTLRRSATS